MLNYRYYPGEGKTAFPRETFAILKPGEPSSAQLKVVNARVTANPTQGVEQQRLNAKAAARAARAADNVNANANNANSNSEQTPESENSTTRQLFGGAKRKHRRTKKSKKSKKSKRSKKTRRNQ
jgi:hypothetical protein